MRRFWLSVVIGLVASLALLAGGFFLVASQHNFIWLSHLAFGIGEWLFPYIRQSGLVRTGGEALHHGFVLFFSLFSWWFVFAAVGYLLLRRKRA